MKGQGPIVILGRLTPPDSSWWTDADLPRQLTSHVEANHQARMRSSKFSTIEPFQVAGEGMPVAMKRQGGKSSVIGGL